MAITNSTSFIDVMTGLIGTEWNPSEGPNPTIGGWLKAIARSYPAMASYCNSALHLDYFEWCGLTVAYCSAQAGLAPVFGGSDVHRFLFAEAWLEWGDAVSTPVQGDVIVFDWGGGHHHVTLYSEDAGNGYWACLGGNQSHEVKMTNFPKSAVIGIRRASAAAAGVEDALAGAPANLALAAVAATDTAVPNKYPDKPVLPYARTTMGVSDIVQSLQTGGSDTNICRAAYVLICNESAAGRSGINNNYGGLQADNGRWSAEYDDLINGTCVLADSGGKRRRFLCFPNAATCFQMLTSLIAKRGLYVGGTTSHITHMAVNSPADWVLAYQREWVTGDKNATVSPAQMRSLLSLYQNATDRFPEGATASFAAT